MLLLFESRVSISVHNLVFTLNRFTLSRTFTLLLRLTNITIDISVSQLQNQISKLEGKTSITSIRYHLPKFIIGIYMLISCPKKRITRKSFWRIRKKIITACICITVYFVTCQTTTRSTHCKHNLITSQHVWISVFLPNHRFVY